MYLIHVVENDKFSLYVNSPTEVREDTFISILIFTSWCIVPVFALITTGTRTYTRDVCSIPFQFPVLALIP